jgi:hypothetical protein
MFGIKQKLLFTSIISLLIVACKNNSNENRELIQLFNSNTVESGRAIDQSTQLTLNLLENRSEEPTYSEVVTPWFKQAQRIYTDATPVINKFSDIKSDNTNNSQKLTALYKDLQNFRKDHETTDSFYLLEFNKDFLFIDLVFKQIGIITSPNGDIVIKNNIDPDVIPEITLVECKFKILLNNIITYCYSKINTHSIGPDFYSSIVAQNAQIFEPGSTIEIYAGIGAFSKSSKPSVLINGNKIPLNDMGYAKFKSKTPKTPGNYTMPVQISFFNQLTGKDEIKQVTIEYKVVKPCD